jgi:glycosyltransferase involved in cell wall biosynthesis
MSGDAAVPDVSVILTTYHAGDAVKQTIDAVLAQSLVNIELIVVDDCSRDATLPVVRGYDDKRLRLFVTPQHLGMAGARNQAVGVARGRYIAALGQHDLCRKDRLSRQVAYLDAHTDVVLLGAATRIIRDEKEQPDRFPSHTTPGLVWWMLHVLNPLVWSSVMMRADALRGLEFFARDDAPLAEDFDLYHRLGALGRVARLDDALVTRRWQAPVESRVDDLRMTNSAAKVLAEAYKPWFGPASQAYAELMVTHIAAGRPVSEASTLNRIAAVMQSVERNFAAAYQPDSESRGLILAEMSRLWWAAARAAIRAGTVSQALAMENRPDFAAADGLTPKDLFRSSLIGGLRARRGA